MLVAGATGGIGSAIVLELIKQNMQVIAFSKSKQKLNDMFGQYSEVICVAGDALNDDEVRHAAKGVDLIVHAINFPYQHWQHTQLKSLQHLINAAKQENVPFIMLDNIYAYSKSKTPINERAEKNPQTKKGQLRLQMEQLIKTSGISYMICHIPDVYGPRAINTLLYMMLEGVVKNKTTFYMAKLHTLREYAYTDDVARTVVELIERPSCYMQNWNIPGALRMTGHDLLSFFQKHFAYQKSFMSISKFKLTLISLFLPLMKEVKELFYLYEEPMLLDGSKLEKELGRIHYTNLEKSLIETYQWMKNMKNTNIN